MVDSDIVPHAYISFVHNRLAATHTLDVLEAHIESAWNLVPFFGARRRKRIEREITEVENRIADYKIAEAGIQVGNYSPAITTLRRIADEKDVEEPFDAMMARLSWNTRARDAILASPQVIAMNMRRMARNLEQLPRT